MKLIVIGAGPHFFGRYAPVLVAYKGIEVSFVVDLQSRRDWVSRWVKKTLSFKPELIFLPDSMRLGPSSEEIEARLGPILRRMEGEDYAVMVCAEPGAKLPYLYWLAERGARVFTDKPIFAPADGFSRNSFMRCFDELLAIRDANNAFIEVSNEKRYNPAYLQFFKAIKEAVTSDYKLSGVYISFSGGIYNRPSDYLEREDHPYKYGYGVLFHSGYHYVDILAQLLELVGYELNERNSLSLHTFVRPPSVNRGKLKLGEIELHTVGVVGTSTEAISLRMSLNDISVSSSSNERVDNIYLNGGRVRIERVEAHFGFEQSVILDGKSYLSNHHAYTVDSIKRNPMGGLHTKHFDENSLRTEYNWGQRKFGSGARVAQFEKFLKKELKSDNILSHRLTYKLLSEIYDQSNILNVFRCV